MNTLIQLPGNGDCLYNAILIGYVNAHAGQYPIINGVEVRTQQHLILFLIINYSNCVVQNPLICYNIVYRM